MPNIDLSGLTPEDSCAVERALERDPALAAELRAIVGALDPGLRIIFLRAFADKRAPAERPAAAVLEALVRTAAAGSFDR